MKRIFLIAAIFSATAIAFTSCGPSRSLQPQRAPRPPKPFVKYTQPLQHTVIQDLC